MVQRAIWGTTLPAFRQAWKSVDKVTSEAFVGMWRARVAEFYSKIRGHRRYRGKPIIPLRVGPRHMCAVPNLSWRLDNLMRLTRD